MHAPRRTDVSGTARIPRVLARWLAHALLAVIAAASAADDVLSGDVSMVVDGDSLRVRLDSGSDIEVRLAEIDAPEHGQPYGDEARATLQRLVDGARIRLEVQDIDRHGRLVARVYAGDVDVCGEMIRSGAAWAYRRYLRDERLVALEDDARAAPRGLWRLPEAERVAPWDWRHAHSGRGTTPTLATNRPAECVIKGNVGARGERIYHVPGQRHYDATQISASRGERWFCTETEARAAGWRRSQQ